MASVALRTQLDALATTARFLWNHPLTSRNRPGAIGRWVRWQVGSRLLPGAAVVPFVGRTVLAVTPGMTGATGNVYAGLHEFEDMAFLLHYLRNTDLFLDVGANVGTYSILAGGVSGASGVAIEPLPQAFDALRTNLRLNALDGRIRPLNLGLGARSGELRFTSSLDTVNHVVSDEDSREASVAVPVRTLDEVVESVVPSLIKIDVEGFELEVFRGGARVLREPVLQALIVELNGSGLRYGFSDAQVHEQLVGRGFAPATYDPFDRRLTLCSSPVSGGNTLYVRNLGEVNGRVRSGPAFQVLGTTV